MLIRPPNMKILAVLAKVSYENYSLPQIFCESLSVETHFLSVETVTRPTALQV